MWWLELKFMAISYPNFNLAECIFILLLLLRNTLCIEFWIDISPFFLHLMILLQCLLVAMVSKSGFLQITSLQNIIFCGWFQYFLFIFFEYFDCGMPKNAFLCTVGLCTVGQPCVPYWWIQPTKDQKYSGKIASALNMYSL